MKGLAFRKLSRSTSHRDALLRNLVTSLIQHERISTTFAKAKEAQRMAEKIITKAKREFIEHRRGRQGTQAQSYIYNPVETMKGLRMLAERYADRPGGYTRLHLHGNRKGDNAPRALLELVDQPKGDLKLHMTAMAIGRQMFVRTNQAGDDNLIQSESASIHSTPIETDLRYNELTRLNASKVIRYGGEEARKLMMEKAKDQFFRLMAMRQLEGDHRIDEEKIKSLQINKPRGKSTSFTPPMKGQRRFAGMRKDVLQSGPDEPVKRIHHGTERANSVIRISKGVFAKRQHRRVYIPPSSVTQSSTSEAEAV